jgi:hypothetical protein
VACTAVFVMIGAEPCTEASTAGASKRVAGAVGDGAMVVRFAHGVLAA